MKGWRPRRDSQICGSGNWPESCGDHGAGLDGGHPGTFGSATKSQKIDYILLSPELFSVVENAGVFRKGVWAGKDGDKFEHFSEMTKPIHAASDHAALR